MKKGVRKFICGALSGLCNGLFGSGGGVIAVFALERLLKMPSDRSHACALCIMLPLSCISIIFYFSGKNVDLSVLKYVVPSFFVGSIIGAKLFSKLSNNFLSKFFIGLTITGAIFMLIL